MTSSTGKINYQYTESPEYGSTEEYLYRIKADGEKIQPHKTNLVLAHNGSTLLVRVIPCEMGVSTGRTGKYAKLEEVGGKYESKALSESEFQWLWNEKLSVATDWQTQKLRPY